MSTFLFLMDAMRSDYITIEDTPFLHKCSINDEYYKRVIPNFGFCERTEIFTGLNPKQSGFFTAIGFDPPNSPFQNLKGMRLLKSLDEKIPNRLTIPFIHNRTNFHELFRKVINRYVINQTGISPQRIPLKILNLWALTEDRIDHRNQNAFNVSSIFSLIKNANKTYYYDAFSALNIPYNGTDNDRLEMALNDKKKSNSDFYPIYISTADFYGHEYGPNSSEIKTALNKLDKKLERFVNRITKIDNKSNYIFLGDHGMAEVEYYFDIEKIIKRIAKNLGMELYEDYIYFLDSTLVRIWFFNKMFKKPFTDNFTKNSEINTRGIIIDKKIAKNENIPWGDKRYGDLIWWAETGTLVFPDFFHREKKYKGMHGYNVRRKENNGMCIIKRPHKTKKYHEKMHLKKTFYILKDLLNI